MKLTKLLLNAPTLTFDPDIKGITADSREVKDGFIFAALPGEKQNGADFIPEAIKKGASVILTTNPPPPLPTDIDPKKCLILADGNPRKKLAEMASFYYPKQPPQIAAVTGTNGKTSVCSFLRQIWEMQSKKAASIGTMGVIAKDIPFQKTLTTPDPVSLHKCLHELTLKHVHAVAMEASSHGLAQHRLDGIRLTAAAFTNLTRDHLDYHGSMNAYLQAKARLFSDLLSINSPAVINADLPESDLIRAFCMGPVISYGQKGKEICLHDTIPEANGQHLRLSIMGQRYNVFLPLSGHFQAMNALCALGLAIATGSDPFSAVSTLEKLNVVAGRLEHIGTTAKGGDIYVDFAHTPDGLETVLKSIKPHCEGRLIVLFGCGGDRDPGKRPLMGQIAEKHANHIIVTDDNPRSEDPALIREAIMEACPKADNIGDRKEALKTAFHMLKKGDILIAAGKGHETGQIIGTKTYPFDERAFLKDLLEEEVK